jgi:carbon-monoxide dehydrogenase small subunit
MDLRVTVNGVAHERDVEPRVLLVDFLRDDLQLTGTHIGCEDGKCGACTVLVDGTAVKSCMAFAVQADGTEVSTVEGLAEGRQLHPLQAAFQEHHALQCGFCTPGFLMAAVALLERDLDTSEDGLRQELVGNLCRCTGYDNIVKAIRSVAQSGCPAGRDQTSKGPGGCDRAQAKAGER